MSSISRLTWAGVAALFLSTVIATSIAIWGHPPADTALVRDLHTWIDGPLEQVFRAASIVGYAPWLAPITVVLAAGLVLARQLMAAFVVSATMLITMLLNYALKQVFERARPNLDPELALHGSFSMPSGHASAAAAFATACVVAWFLVAPGARRARWASATIVTLALLFAITVGVSRPVLGVHWPSDVLAGWLEGAGVALLLGAGALRMRDRTVSPR